MFLLVETLESWYSGLVTALLEKPMKRVSPLKAGRSSRIKAGANPVTFVDPEGLQQFTAGPQVQKAIQMIDQLGYPKEAAHLRAKLASGGLSDLPNGWPGGGFTNPFTKNMGINPGECQSSSANMNFVYLTETLYHEARHSMTQSRGQLLSDGIQGHWFGIPSKRSALETPMYQDSVNFLTEWRRQSRGGPNSMIPEINQRIRDNKAHLSDLQDAVKCQKQYRTEEYPFGLYK